MCAVAAVLSLHYVVHDRECAEMAFASDRHDHPVPGGWRRRCHRSLGGDARCPRNWGSRSSSTIATAPRGTIGFNGLAAADCPMGYTIGFGPTTPIANAPYLVKGVRYQVDLFDYVCQIFENVFTIAGGARNRSSNRCRQLIDGGERESRQAVSYGHAGTGTIPHLAMENFARCS